MTVFTGISLECVVAVLIVGFLWGATNPFLRLGSMCSFNEECEASVNNNAIRNNTWNQMLSPIFDLAKLFSSWKFLIPFVVNQSASVMFIYLVSIFPVSLIVPCVNALQFVFTAIIGHLIGERILTPRSCVGIVFVFLGILIMMISDAYETS